jgi:hypothetical protein
LCVTWGSTLDWLTTAGNSATSCWKSGVTAAIAGGGGDAVPTMQSRRCRAMKSRSCRAVLVHRRRRWRRQQGSGQRCRAHPIQGENAGARRLLHRNSLPATADEPEATQIHF